MMRHPVSAAPNRKWPTHPANSLLAEPELKSAPLHFRWECAHRKLHHNFGIRVDDPAPCERLMTTSTSLGVIAQNHQLHSLKMVDY